MLDPFFQIYGINNKQELGLQYHRTSVPSWALLENKIFKGFQYNCLYMFKLALAITLLLM